jgi:putative heme-binding domain-containing protein
VGGKVGPDITGSNRADLEYLLSNILDPSAVMAKEYKPTILTTTDGRTLSGIVKQEDKQAVVLVTANETLTVPRSEIDNRRLDDKSMMPDDLLKPLSDAEVRALVAYLRGPGQVPLQATADNVKDFFNGRDLSGWDGDPKVWSVEKGEIVGRGVGLKRDAFLRSDLLVGDFRLTFQVKVSPSGGQADVLFRAEGLPDGGAKGYRVGLGNGAWGQLSEEAGRGLLASKAGEPPIKAGEWTRYEIVATGNRIRTAINGTPWFDLSDADGARRGIIALHLSGGVEEIRFKNVQLELLK